MQPMYLTQRLQNTLQRFRMCTPSSASGFYDIVSCTKNILLAIIVVTIVANDPTFDTRAFAPHHSPWQQRTVKDQECNCNCMDIEA